MARDISVSIAVQGEKEFNRALKDAQSAVKVLASELKASEAAFDENADAQAFFANKTKNISDQIDQQKTILNSLKQAIADAGEEFGEASAKTDKYRIAANKTQAEIAKLERSLRETQREAEEFGRDSTRIGRQMEDGIGDAADDVSDRLDRMVKQINQDLEDIGKGVDLSVAIDIGGAVKDVVSGALGAMNDLVDGTEDYRRSMSFIETGALLEGLDMDQLKKLAFEAASVTGDLDNAMEGLQNLTATGLDMKELAEAIELVTGAVIKFPSMDFASISEGILETIQTGSATGGFLELLEKLGTGEEKIKALNKALASTNNLEVRQQDLLGYLNEQGLEKYVQTWRELYPEMEKAEKAQIRLMEAQANLAKSFTPISTAGTNAMASLIEGLTSMVEALNKSGEESRAAMEEINQAVEESGLQEDLIGLNERIAEAYSAGDNELARTLEKEHTETIKKIAEIRRQVAEEIDKPLETTTEEGGRWIDEALKAKTDLEQNSEEYIQNFRDMVTEQMNTAFGEETDADREAWDAFRRMLLDGAAGGEEEFNKAMSQIGANAPTLIGNAIIENEANALRPAEQMLADLRGVLQQKIVIPAPTFAGFDSGGINLPSVKGSLSGGDGSSVKLVAEIDGRTVAQSTTQHVNREMGADAMRLSTYG
ncbi:MAG: hypothetical protein IJ418_09100 [Clostridia bacterium]|nr:hypothetical protein [Clostridia bacterium]